MLPHIILLTKSRTQSVTPLSATWSTGFSGGDSQYWVKGYGIVSVTDGTNILSGLEFTGATVTGNNNGTPIQLNILWLSPSTGYSWTYATPYPLTAQLQVAEFLSPYFYFIGGGTPASRTVYVTDTGGNSWTAIASTNKGRRQGGLAKIGSTLYAFGGIGGDPAPNGDGDTSWEYYNGSSWVNGGSLPVSFTNSSNLAKTIGSNIYILGSGFPNNFSPFYKFDGTNLTALTNTPITARYSANTVLSNRFYIIGGQLNSSDHALVHSTDATGATWQVETPLPYTRSFASAITYLNQVFVFAGQGTDPDGSSLNQRTIYRNSQT